jgi:hypothetical protein
MDELILAATYLPWARHQVQRLLDRFNLGRRFGLSLLGLG